MKLKMMMRNNDRIQFFPRCVVCVDPSGHDNQGTDELQSMNLNKYEEAKI